MDVDLVSFFSVSYDRTIFPDLNSGGSKLTFRVRHDIFDSKLKSSNFFFMNLYSLCEKEKLVETSVF